MNILRKITACLAAAAVMAGAAVTASAEYVTARADPRDGSGHGFAIMGLPSALKGYVFNGGYVKFSNSDGECEYQLIFMLDRTGSKKHSCSVVRYTDGEFVTLDEDIRIDAGNLGEFGDTALFSFSESSGWFEIFSKYENVGVSVSGATARNGQPAFDYFSSTGETVADDYFEWTTIDWELSENNTESSEPTSEPTSSEQESNSGYVEPGYTEPESSAAESSSGYVEPGYTEPTSSEPVSEPAYSEPTSESAEPSAPANVDTGVTSVAAVIGVAALAAGAVIVTRKRK